MNKNINSRSNLLNPAKLNLPQGTIIAETLLHLLRINKIKKVYSQAYDKDPLVLINSLFDLLELKYVIPENDLKNIPSEGPFIIVSNHPYRGIDSMLLYKILSQKRKDFKIIANFLLKDIEALKDIIIPVRTYETTNDPRTSYAGIKEALVHIKEGHCLAIFPAGEMDAHIEVSKVILDGTWQNVVLKFIKHAAVPVIPVYFHGTNSRLYHIVGKIPSLKRNVKLPAEILHKRNRNVKVRVGSPITVKEQSEFKDIAQYGRYLRARTYSLGSALEAKKFFNRINILRLHKAEPLAESVPKAILSEEYNTIRADYELFSTKNYSVICAPTSVIPNIFSEIGRLRELTFRKVGEGTNKSADIDEYDFYFNHLFVWDTDAEKIVGAYRIGKGKDILNTYGTSGFYIDTLFKIKKSFSPILSESLELGRSFITDEYQKKPIPLFILWKGIMVFLLQNAEYRYLIGPVSISNDFSKFSKGLIVEFVRKYFYDESLSGYIVPRKEFIVKPDKAIDRNVFIDTSEKDINKIEKIIIDIQPGYRLPVLLKRYLEINGKIIGFNIDPKFNYCLDGLLILDLYNTPQEFIKALSRELDDPSIMNRFAKKE